MYSHLEHLPAPYREKELLKIESDIKNGTHNPIPDLVRQVRNREQDRRRNSVTLGATFGGLGAVVLGTALSLNPSLIGVTGGGIVLAFVAPGITRYRKVKEDLDRDRFIEYLTDEEIEELDDFQQKFQPATDEAKEAHLLIKLAVDEVMEDEEETINVKSEEVKKYELDEPNPWLDGAALNEKGPTKKLTLPEDNFIDKVDKTIEESANRLLGEELSEIRHVQEVQMEAIGQRIDTFEKTFLEALKKVNSSDSELKFNSNRIAETPGIPGFELNQTFNSVPNQEKNLNGFNPIKSVVISKTFDPGEPEDDKEYATYKSLVELENMSPKGNPIIEKLWGVKPGGSKKYQQALERRDEYAARLAITPKLYGE